MPSSTKEAVMGRLVVKCNECGGKEKAKGVTRDNVDEVEQKLIDKHEKKHEKK
jgi:hypothetical protein